MSIFSWRDKLPCLSVGQRIGIGYALALGVAITGTVTGFCLGKYYDQQAAKREAHARNEVELLHRVQSGILQARTHQLQLIPLLKNSKQFQQEYSHILHHKIEVDNYWHQLALFSQHEPIYVNDTDHKKILKWYQSYENIPDLYFQELSSRYQQIRSFNLELPRDLEKSQQILLEFTNSDLALKFDGISDDLEGLIKEAYEASVVAEKQQEAAQSLAQQIVISSIGLSILVSIILALLTSRAIATPIQALTTVARKSTEESNFNLQVPIEREDEIGILANSFNQLIYSVKQLLEQQKTANKQLAAANETLERKVEERTQELSDKNIYLQQLLEKLQRTQIQMVQNEKMSALGQMVAGIAHEINNPVNFIYANLTHVREYSQNLLDFVQFYQQEFANETVELKADRLDIEFIQKDLPKILDSMKTGADRIRKIVLSLRNFSRTDEAEFKAVDIHEGIDSTLLILQHRLKEKSDYPGIEIIKNYSNLPLIECYPGQLNQVFMNILANAIDAIEEIKIGQKYQEIKENPGRITISSLVIDNQWVRIVIADNGAGISTEIQQYIFNPFFTTKPIGQGTGMGMSISYQIIIEKHGGKLNFISQPGQGTEFIIDLPLKHSVTN